MNHTVGIHVSDNGNIALTSSQLHMEQEPRGA